MARLYVELTPRMPGDILATYACTVCNRSHSRVWCIERRRARTLGHYVTFRINGQEIAYDPTLPHVVERLPRDAREVPHAFLSTEWHSSDHFFGTHIPADWKVR